MGSLAAQGPESNAMRAWIAKWPAVSFYVLTLLAQGRRVAPGSLVTHFPGLLGPMLAAMVVTAVIGGRKALCDLLRRMFRLGPHGFSNLMWAVSPLVLGAGAFATMQILGKPIPSVGTFAHFPGLPHDWPLAGVVATVIVVNGFGEETGWRGLLTERLPPRYGRFRATLVVALLWALWHAGYNMMVATESGTGLRAAIVGAVRRFQRA